MSQNSPGAASDQRLTNHPEEQAVREPLENYMRGHATDNPTFMRQAFMDTAHIESVREGPLTSWTLDTYCLRFKGTPAADEATRRRTINAIDIAGTAASAKITHGSWQHHLHRPLRVAQNRSRLEDCQQGISRSARLRLGRHRSELLLEQLEVP